MKAGRESIGAWLFRKIEKPEWAEKKLRYWPLAILVFGVVMIFGPGLSLPIKPSAEFPFMEVEKHKTGETESPISFRAIGVGVALMALGFLCSIPFIAIDDKEQDKHTPQDKKDLDPGSPVLFLESPLNADRDQIARMLAKFGKRWPKTTVRWPLSSQRILDEAETLVKSSHRLDPKNAELIGLYKRLPDEIADARSSQDKLSNAIPGMIARCSKLPDEGLARVIASYLTLANYRALRGVYRSLFSAKKSFAGIDLPKSWDVLADNAAALSVLHDASHPSELRRGILIAVGDEPVYSDHGFGVSIVARKGFLYHRMALNGGGALSLIAELESEIAQRGGALPTAYEGDMLFCRIGPVGNWLPGLDPEVASDADLEKLSEEYTRRWNVEHEQKPA